MDRRGLLKALAVAPLMAGATRLYAAPATDSRLLVVFLRGGYDCANLLVPISSQFYYDMRPNIAVARPDVNPAVSNPLAALPLTADWGLHPALRNSIYPLYQKGQVAFVPFAGTEDLTRSHFETQDSIELGQPLDRGRDYRSGFLNRLVTVLTADKFMPRPISFTDQLPISLRGDVLVPNMALRSVGKPGVDARQGGIIEAMYRNSPLSAPVNEGFGVREEVMKAMAVEMDQASRNAISAKGFEAEARRIAGLMREKFNVGFVDIGGWDTHVGEGAGSGYLAGRLEELGRGLAGFADEMGASWDRTTVVVVSEFGRTFRENGNRGTDHGHGTVYWVLGGGIKGGQVAGEQIAVDQAHLFQNRDYPVLNEYRSVFGGLFQQMYGFNADQLQRVFQRAQPRNIGLI